MEIFKKHRLNINEQKTWCPADFDSIKLSLDLNPTPLRNFLTIRKGKQPQLANL